MKLRVRKLVCHCVLFAQLATVLCFRASASVFDNFDSGNDNAWTHLEPLAPFGAPGTFTFPNGGYRIQAAGSPDPSNIGPGLAGSLRLDQLTSNLGEECDIVGWNNGLNQSFGLLGRVADPGFGTTTGYAFTYSTAGFISISAVLGERRVMLASAPITLDSTKVYRLDFSALGRALTGVVYAQNHYDSALAGVSVVDSSFGQGSTGLYVSGEGSEAADATFDNFAAVNVIPEPSTMHLMLFAAGLLGAIAKWLSGRRTRTVNSAENSG